MNGIQATLTIFAPELSDAINESISQKRYFTTVTDNVPSDIASRSITLICLDLGYIGADEVLPRITHIGFVEKGSRVSTGQVRLKCTNIVELPDIKQEDLLEELPPRLAGYFSIGYKKVPPKAGQMLLEALLGKCPDQRAEIEQLIGRGNGISYSPDTPRFEDMALEKDALGICLDIFGADRAKVLGSWDKSNGASGLSFLTGLTDYKVYEDEIINHDLRNVPGMELISSNISGIAEFENSREGQKLVVINANRKPLEKALGVDLIYYHEVFKAFTFVQYKMMDKQSKSNGGEHYYNPRNTSHDEELNRMNLMQNFIEADGNSGSLDDYRLIPSPFLFKLCKNIGFMANDTSIATGAYIPLPQWNLLIHDKSVQGSRGGVQIGFHTLKGRYLRKDAFIELVKNGFIGTQSISSKKLNRYIRELIAKGHSVIYAVDLKPKRNREK
ncbi:hypothetical protein [Mangrovibacterium marinum]|uniref:hypothetical protein n=1 Tax=Mangrovibacterium marinum TaxID=1639118 RepID=UPI002A18D092|nr:hypothetical protein [Mangrovibacterium marinum]